MVTVGITGGIGSGKSTVAKIWQSLGAYYLNADDLAKNIMVNNTAIRQNIIDTFGEESYREDGTLNREWLSREAFGKNRAEELNRIVHPHIPEETRKVINEAEQQGYSVFVYEAALLMENLQPGVLDYIVLVLAEREKRIHRVIERDKVEEQAVIDRMNTQKDFNRYRDRADIVIENNGSMESLEQRAGEIYRLFLDD